MLYQTSPAFRTTALLVLALTFLASAQASPPGDHSSAAVGPSFSDVEFVHNTLAINGWLAHKA